MILIFDGANIKIKYIKRPFYLFMNNFFIFADNYFL